MHSGYMCRPSIYQRKQYLQLGKQLVALGQERRRVVDKLIDNCLGRLLLVHHSGDLTHQVRAGVLKVLIINIVGNILHIVLDWDYTLRCKLFNFRLAVVLPVEDVVVLAYAQGTALKLLADYI